MIIAFSGAAGAGKSTAAKALDPMPWGMFQYSGSLVAKDMFVHLPFALVLKEMIACIDPSLLNHEGKEKPTDILCGKSPRYAMKTLGTEWGRVLIGTDLWVELWRRRAEQCPNVVADDLRFQNEYEAVKRQPDAFVVEIRRPGVERSGDHPSEAWAPPADFVIVNDGDAAALGRNVGEALRYFGRR